jgi:hypothetical protein
MKAAFPYIDDFVPAGTLASLEILGEILAGASTGTGVAGRAVTAATTVSPSVGLSSVTPSDTILPPTAIDRTRDPNRAQPIDPR